MVVNEVIIIKISVIIPVYNSQSYLERCLESVSSQTYSNIEVIIVDDGSTDASSHIYKRFEKDNSNVIVINKSNGGLSSARNAGMIAATGEYIFFLDSDDWLDSNYIEKCADKVLDKQVDLLFTPYIREYRGCPQKNDLFENKHRFFSKDDVCCVLLRKLFGEYGSELQHPAAIDDFSTAWGKFYKTEYCKKISFVDTKIIGTEDAWFNINYLSKIKNAQYFGDVYYHYYKQNDDSLVTSYNSNLLDGWKNLYKLMNQFIEKNKLGDPFSEALNNRIVIDLLAVIRNITNSSLKRRKKIRLIQSVLREDIYKKAFKKFNFSYLTFKWRLFYELCYHHQAVTIYLMLRVAEPMKTKLK